MTTTTTAPTDRERLRAAFAALRKLGYFARMNFWCCQSCAWSDVPDGKQDKVIFWHKQDNEAFDPPTHRWRGTRGRNMPRRDGDLMDVLHLAWAGDATVIRQALEAQGLRVEHNGTEQQRIAVVPYDRDAEARAAFAEIGL